MLGHAVITPGQPAGWTRWTGPGRAAPASWKLYTIGTPFSARPSTVQARRREADYVLREDRQGRDPEHLHSQGADAADYEQSWAGVWKYQTPGISPRWRRTGAAQLHHLSRGASARSWTRRGGPGRVREDGRHQVGNRASGFRRRAAPRTSMRRWAPASPPRGDRPAVRAAVIGTWVKGLGATNVVWGTDSLFHGSPQWQMRPCATRDPQRTCGRSTALRRSARPTGPRRTILGLNSARRTTLASRDYRR